MRCILHGHREVIQEGKGEYTGAFAKFCPDCGKVFETWGDAPAHQKPQAQEAARVPIFR